MSETLKNSIHFAGERVSDRIVRRPLQMVTLRAEAKPYQDGESVRATFDDHEDSIIHVISQRVEQIQDMHPGLLLLDGVLKHSDAVAIFETHYPHKGPWTVTSHAARTLFLADEFMQAAGPAENMRLRYGQSYYEKPDYELDLLRDWALGTFFFPAFYYWLIEYHGIPTQQYPQELLVRELIDEDRAKGMQELWQRTKQLEKAGTTKKRELAKFYGWHYILGDTAEGLGIR